MLLLICLILHSDYYTLKKHITRIKMMTMKNMMFRLLAIVLCISTFTACNDDYTENHPYPQELPEAKIIEIVEDAEMPFYEDEQKEEGLLYTKPVVRISITYPSAAPDNSPATLSGAILMTPDVYSGKKKARGIIIFSHYTIFHSDEAPSLGNVWVEKWFLGNKLTEDFIAVSSDLFGFGTTEQYAQNYLHTESVGRQNVDCYLNAKTILDEMGYSYGDLLFCAGFSAGGHGAMAVQKYVDTHYRGEITINKTYAGGGSYDLTSVVDAAIESDHSNYICATPLLLISFNENSNLNIPYEKMFKSPLLENYNEWLISKKYDEIKINSFLNTNRPSDILTEEFRDKNSEVRKTLEKAFDENTLTSGWIPDPNANILIVHTLDDSYVPVVSALEMHQFLVDQGVTNTEGLFPETGDHAEAMVQMIGRAIFDMVTWK